MSKQDERSSTPQGVKNSNTQKQGGGSDYSSTPKGSTTFTQDANRQPKPSPGKD